MSKKINCIDCCYYLHIKKYVFPRCIHPDLNKGANTPTDDSRHPNCYDINVNGKCKYFKTKTTVKISCYIVIFIIFLFFAGNFFKFFN